MLVTLDGIVMLLRLEQFQNVYSPILVTPDGIVMFVNPEQPENA